MFANGDILDGIFKRNVMQIGKGLEYSAKTNSYSFGKDGSENQISKGNGIPIM